MIEHQPNQLTPLLELKPGELRFFDNFLPSLPAGSYRLVVEQTLEGDNLKKTFQNKRSFIVDAPRFQLNTSDIHSIYPPADGQGQFEDALPQIVFKSRSLPWERTIFEEKTIPWFALLVLEPDEILVSDWSEVSRTGAKTIKVKDLKQPDPSFLKPNLTNLPTDDDDSQCLAVEISGATFNTILPRKEELPYLSHVRAVNTADKDLSSTTSKGWFSTTYANRLPKAPEGNPTARNIVHLVSLEGFEAYLGNETIPEHLNVRLVSLVSWEFYCEPPKEEFDTLMNHLVKQTDLLRINLDKTPTTPEATYLSDALKGGFTPIKYNTRQGESTLAWYRSPFTPTISLRQNYPPSFSAESAMIYDEERGVFDVSNAVAWQIGRLLGLSDEYFSQSLLQWKKTANEFLDQLFAKQNFYKTIVKALNEAMPDSPLEINDLDELMNPNTSNNLLAQMLQQALGEIGLEARGLDRQRTIEEILDKAKVELEGLPGILNQQQYDELLASQKDLNTALMKALFEE